MLIHPRYFRALSAFMSDDVCLPGLNGVNLEPDGTITATNGHVLLSLKPTRPPDEDFPAPRAGDSSPAPITAPVILPAEVVALVGKWRPKGMHLPILEHVQVGADKLRATNLDIEQQTPFRPLEGPFPNYEQVIPKGEPTYTISIGAPVLRAILSAQKTLGEQVSGALVFNFHKPTGAFTVRIMGCEAEHTLVGMPCRLPEPPAAPTT